MPRKAWNWVCRIIFGPALLTSAISYEKLSVLMGLVVFGADPLSSTAYATEEMFLALQHGGFGPEHFWIAIPIAFVISTFIFVITFSYRQIVHAFPSGGGVYSVARAHLGETPSLVGAA